MAVFTPLSLYALGALAFHAHTSLIALYRRAMSALPSCPDPQTARSPLQIITLLPPYMSLVYALPQSQISLVGRRVS